MKKQDLKTGMIVRTEDSTLRIVWGNNLVGVTRGGGIPFTWLEDNMEITDDDPVLSVIEVWSEPSHHALCANFTWWFENDRILEHCKLLWKRKEEVPMPHITNGEIFYSEDKASCLEMIFRNKRVSEIHDKRLDVNYYSVYIIRDIHGGDNVFRVADVLCASDIGRTCKIATPEQCAKLVRKEIKNGYYWNGKELTKL